MTIAQELDAFLHKHNTETKESAKVSFFSACVLWPMCFVLVFFFARKLAMSGIGLLALAYFAINLIAAMVLILRKSECEAVASSSGLDGAQNRSIFTRLGVFEISTVGYLFLLPARMTADAVTRFRQVVSLDAGERMEAEDLMGRLKKAAEPVGVQPDMFAAPVFVKLIQIGAIRLENDRYGNPTLSRRLPPDPLEAFDRD